MNNESKLMRLCMIAVSDCAW